MVLCLRDDSGIIRDMELRVVSVDSDEVVLCPLPLESPAIILADIDMTTRSRSAALELTP